MANDYAHSAGLMWPATFDGSENVDDPHCTNMFLGDTEKLAASPVSILHTIKDYLDAPGEVAVVAPEVFGDDEKVWVATLDTSKLNLIQSAIQDALGMIGVLSASSFPDYRPHVTMGPAKDETNPPAMPEFVTLGEPQVWFGDDHYVAVR